MTSGKTDGEFQSGAGVSAPNTGIAKVDLGGTFGLAVVVLLLGGVGCLVAAAYRWRYQS